MSCYVRLMGKEDTVQVTEIDRQAFPTLWPPVNYQRELQNRMAHYVVACEGKRGIKQATLKKSSPEKGYSQLVLRLRQLFNQSRFSSNGLSLATGEYIIGFAGFWLMAGEAHLTNIAVREHSRRQGVGESLLISIFELATELEASIITLEVRTSNIAARRLYSKYGFSQVGLRRGYYSDNMEDAVLMSTTELVSLSLQARLQRLKRTHCNKWGVTFYRVGQ